MIDRVEGWTFVDRDGKTTFGIEGASFPNNGKPMAYMVIDRKHAAFQGEFTPRSGDRCLVSFNADDSSVNDNWAISPLLNGKPQTIRFAAKAQTSAYGYEAFEFLYSTTGTDPDSFVKAGDDKRVGAEWKEYSFDVPQGAKYFAIRCVSEDSFAFLVDDVMYTPAALPEQSAPDMLQHIPRHRTSLRDQRGGDKIHRHPSRRDFPFVSRHGDVPARRERTLQRGAHLLHRPAGHSRRRGRVSTPVPDSCGA